MASRCLKSRSAKTTSTSKKFVSPNTSSGKLYVEKKKIPPIYRVRWVDAQTTGGAEWMDHGDMTKAAKAKLPVMNTVGFLIYEDDLQYAIVATMGPSESSQVNKIPKCMVLQAVLLVEETDG